MKNGTQTDSKERSAFFTMKRDKRTVKAPAFIVQALASKKDIFPAIFPINPIKLIYYKNQKTSSFNTDKKPPLHPVRSKKPKEQDNFKSDATSELEKNLNARFKNFLKITDFNKCYNFTQNNNLPEGAKKGVPVSVKFLKLKTKHESESKNNFMITGKCIKERG